MSRIYILLLLVGMLHGYDLSASKQCVVGVADSWNSSYVTLSLYEKNLDQWNLIIPAWQGRLGKSGLVWGLGLHRNREGVNVKKEGDNRSPAGAFAIGGAWGYAPNVQKNPRQPYTQVTSRDLWVEDASSSSYNTHVRLNHEPASEWEKHQQMKQNDPVHSLKLFIAHNAPPRVTPGAGSSIFFHIWRKGGSVPTAGCTTMSEAKLRALIAQIDPAKRPVYVLLTKKDYESLRPVWKLP